MVIEGLIVQAIKLAAGSYIKDIDPSKLTTSLWNGSVQLERIELKPNAFDQFNLPVRIHRGFAENVKIAVPISDLYHGKWEVEIGTLYLSVGPITSFKYDKKTADREAFEVKERQLQKVENNKQKAALEKEGKEEGKGFFGGVKEVLLAHLLKVVEIRVGNVHVQYEDAVSHQSHPFACGVTIEGLYIQSTNGQWKVGKQSSSDEIIFKLAQLNNLAVYWNPDTSPTTTFDFFWESSMKSGVAKGDWRPPNVKYIFGPMSAKAKIQLNTVAGTIVDIPAVKVELGVETVAVKLSKLQYDGVLSLLDSMDRMMVQKRFIEYRPLTPLTALTGRDKLQWFRYAVNSVISVIHRRRVVWSWEYIRSVRHDFKAYQSAYKKKLQTKKPTTELLEELKELEMRMSLFNIVIARSRAESEVKRSTSGPKAATNSSSWFGWMWSSSADTTSSSDDALHIPTNKELEEEKEKLYESIGYSEGLSGKKKYPIEYVAYVGEFSLQEVSVALFNQDACVASLNIKDASVSVSGRPSASAVKVAMQVGSLMVEGSSSGRMQTPAIITSKLGKSQGGSKSLLKFAFELNPLPAGEDGPDIDQKISMELQPVKVVYDADTVDGMVRMLQMPANVKLHRLSAVAQTTLKDIRMQTRAGLEHALTTRNILDVNVTLQAPYLLVPFGGKYSKGCDVVVIDLGSLRVSSDWSKHLTSDKQIRSATVDELEDAFYDKFTLKLKNVQVLIGRDDQWETARESGQTSPLHVLNPTLFDLTLKKSLIFNDPQRPNIIISGALPDLELQVSDYKIITAVKLLRSLPLPPPALKGRPAELYNGPLSIGNDDILTELTEGGRADDDELPTLHEALSPKSTHVRTTDLPTVTTVLPTVRDDVGSSVERKVETSVDFEDDSDEYETASECSSSVWGATGEGEDHTEVEPPLLPWQPDESTTLDTSIDKKLDDDDAVTFDPITDDSSPERRARIVQAKVDIVLNKVAIAFSARKASLGDIPRLRAELTGLKLSVVKGTFDLSVNVDVGLSTVTDLMVEDSDYNKLIWSESEKLLTVKYIQVDQEHPMFRSKFGSILKLVDASVSEIGMGIMCESLADLLALSKDVLEGVSSHDTPPARPTTPTADVIHDDLAETVVTDVVKTVEDATDIMIVSRFGGLSLSLRNKLDSIMLSEVKDLRATVTITAKLILVEASIGGLCVKDPMAKMYREVLTQGDPSEDFMTVEFRKFSDPVDSLSVDVTSPNMAVVARLKELKIVLLFQFLKRLQVFASRLRVDQGMLKSAKAVASNAAAKTVETIQENSSQRISLDVVIHAPVVSLPLTAESSELFEVRLGELYVTNKFHSVDLPPPSPSPVYEDMTVLLEEASVCRVVMGGTNAVRPLLAPVSVQATIKRNLSPWYQSHDLPQLASIALHMKKTRLDVADDDLTRVLQLIAGNLSDLFRGTEDDKPSRHASNELPSIIYEEGEEPEEEELKDVETPTTVEDKEVVASPKPIGEPPSSPRLTMKVVVDSIGIVVYRSGRSLEVANPTTWPHQSSDELASFALEYVEAFVTQYNATSMNFDLSVDGCVVKDLRKGQKSAVKEFIRKSAMSSDVVFLRVKYNMHHPSPHRQVSEVMVKLPSTEIMVDIQFLYSLEDFVKEILSTQSNVAKKMVQVSASATSSSESVTRSSQNSRVGERGPPQSGPGEREFELTFFISKPKIGVVAASQQSSMLLMTGDVKGVVRTRSSENHQSTKVSVQMFDFRMSNSQLSSWKESSPSGPFILNKANITLSYDAPSSTGKDVLLLVETDGSVNFVFCPSDVRLLLSVLQSVQRPKRGNEEIADTPKDLWKLKDLDRSVWYLQDDEDDTPVSQVPLESLKKALVHKEEEVTIDLGTITITLNHSTTEVGSGGPAFKMVARRVRSVVQNWSSNVTGSASLSVTAAYFNKKFNVWEYVLEPLEEQKGEFCYWSMTAEINPTQDLQNMKGSRLIPKMLCSVYSKESLQITLSRTSIGQLLNLVDEYSKPMESEGRALRSAREGVVQSGRSTYKLRNMLGEQYKVTVQAKDALAEVEGQNTEKTLKDGQEAIFVSMVTHSEDPSAGLLKQEIKQLVWSVRVGGFHARHILFTGFNKTYYPLKPLKESSSQSYGFVVEAEPFSQNVTMVTIRSPVQILNNMAEPCMVAMTMSSGLTSEAVAKAMVVNPGEKIPLSLSVAHEGHTFVKQQSKDIKYSTTSIRWNSKSEKTTVVCPAADGSPSGPPGHYIRVVVVKETDLAKAQLVDMTQRAHHILSLNYPIVICNNLPYRSIVSSSLVPKLEMKRGGSVPIGTCALDEDKHLFSKQPKVSLTLTVFMEGGPWNGSLVIEPEEDKMNVFNVQREKNERTLAVSSEDRGSWRVTLFAPYWMVNKSGVTLDYSIPGGLSFSKSEAVITQTCQQKITFLKLSDDLFKRSTELKIRISKMNKAEPSTWSKAFSLDTAGFCGVIKIEHKSKIHHFGVEVHLSKHGLTKIITISPFFLLENLTNHRITCFEPTVGDKKPSSITVDKKKMVTFHPSVNVEKLQIALDNQKSLSLPFKFTAPSTVLIRTTGDAPAVVAQVKVTTHATLITFSPYYHGAATFLIVNDLKDLTMEFQQNAKEKKAMKNIHVVLPGHTLLYTWDIPDARKELKFWIRGRESKTFLLQPQDACGKFKLPRGFKKWLVYERTARAMMSHGGSRRTDSFYGSYSAPPTPVESEVSGLEDVDGETVAHDRWRQYDEGSSGEDAYDSDLELEETDSEPSTPIKKRQRLKKFFSFGRSTQDLDQSLVDKIKGRWVSFMDNIQRVLLFTLDKDRIMRAQQGQLIQTPDLGVTTSLHSGGLSLVDDIIGKEVSYIGISPCPVVWEWEKRTGYWRPLFTMNAAALEAAYQKYIEASSSAKPTPQTPNSLAVQTIVLQEEEWKVSFGESISMSKVKENEEHGLRRSSSPGIFFKYTTSTNQITLRAKVFSLQVDNQLPNVKFPQVVYGIPPPPSIASSMEPKPLLDTSIIIRKAGKEGTTEYKLIQFVLQKIGIEVELGFLVALSRLFAGWKRPMTDRDTIEADITRVKVDDLKEMLLPALAAEEKSFIDNIMLSPVHIALSLSLSQSSSSEEMQMDPSEGIFGGFDPLAPLRSFLKSFGAFVVDVKGSELKLNRLEGSQLVLTHPELIQMVRHHYTQQVLREVYKAVLNLNVIGNPVSLVGGVASGVTDLFYEPYKAVTLGPEEFVEAVGIGVHSAIGGTVGGALGVVSTFTGKLGDAAALFSRDKDERERRRSDNRELSITYGLGGLIKDFGGAVTNVVVQPVKGAQSEGVIGFLKGTGRGIFGIALRPLGGALDLTTIAVDKLKRVTKIDDYEMVQLRLPRYIGPDQVIRPYSLYSATGKAFLEDLEPSPSDDLFYLTHFEIEADPMKAFLLTTKYALQFSQVGKLDILKKWDRDLEIVYGKVIENTLRSEGRMFKVKVKKDSAFSKLFSSKDEEELTVQLRTPQDAKEAAEAFCQALKKYKLNKV